MYFVEHPQGNAKANGVTFEAAVPAEHEIYFSITDSTHFRAPTMTLTHRGGVDIEKLDKAQVAHVPFDPLTGLKAFVVANARRDRRAAQDAVATDPPWRDGAARARDRRVHPVPVSADAWVRSGDRRSHEPRPQHGHAHTGFTVHIRGLT